MKLLIVEDMAVMARLLQQQLSILGYTDVTISGTAEDALKQISETRFDVAFVDWVLPGRSGIDLVKAVRSHMTQDDISLIMVTGKHSMEDVVEALEAGADTYIAKPIKQKVLQDKLEEIESKRKKGGTNLRWM